MLMVPVLDQLFDGQRRLWDELGATPSEFTLFGGIALSIRFGHRRTADFDFFCRDVFDPQKLYSRVPYLQGAEVLQMASNTLVCSVVRGEPVKVSFFGLPKFGCVGSPEIADGPAIKVAPLLELAGTKTSVIQKRAMARDYLDLDVLMTKGGVSLLDALVTARILYGAMFNPHVALKALVYFGDGNLPTLPLDLQRRLADSAGQIDLEKLAERMRELP